MKDIRLATCAQYSAEEKIRIALEGLRGDDSIAELCGREGIAQGVYYKWSKDFMEAVKKRLADASFGRAQTILNKRERIKRKAIEQRRLHHQKQAASYQPTR